LAHAVAAPHKTLNKIFAHGQFEHRIVGGTVAVVWLIGAPET
jgi:hypothetical protein